ncbi:plastocyanin/azurin family copper-binding protein [Haloarchaeobius sp. HRN-SO-5]|uniref:plastocyanin/azurin family copper-binding protein n=1 Tax=Haloarchaeobius sp. HRN-SO-5 TaxID=3446118 RepID=UPI003EBEE156
MGGSDRPSRRSTLARLAGAVAALGVGGCLGDGTAPDEPDDTGGTQTDVTTAATTVETETADGGTTTGGYRTPSNTDQAADHTVGCYTELYFDPIGLLVQPGETVSFEMVSGAHSATAYHPDNTAALRRRIPDGAPPWDTGVWSDVGTFRNVTFETPGTHDYYCIPHKAVGMVGRIVVDRPGGPAEESPNPDYDLPPSDLIVEQGAVSYDEWAGRSE